MPKTVFRTLVTLWVFALTLLLLGGLTSCVTAGDLQARDAALQRWQDGAELRLEKLADGTVTREEYDREAREAREQLQDDLRAVVENVQDRTERAVDALSSPITGNPLVDLLGTVLLGGAATYTATNRVRDSRRRARSEPVE